jgi:hypothetical protein
MAVHLTRALLADPDVLILSNPGIHHGQKELSRTRAQTRPRTHARTYARAHTHTLTRAAGMFATLVHWQRSRPNSAKPWARVGRTVMVDTSAADIFALTPAWDGPNRPFAQINRPIIQRARQRVASRGRSARSHIALRGCAVRHTPLLVLPLRYVTVGSIGRSLHAQLPAAPRRRSATVATRAAACFSSNGHASAMHVHSASSHHAVRASAGVLSFSCREITLHSKHEWKAQELAAMVAKKMRANLLQRKEARLALASLTDLPVATDLPVRPLF